MKKLLTAAVLSVALSSGAFANTGWLSSYNYTWNGNADTVYTLNGGNDPASTIGTPVSLFNGANLGTFDWGGGSPGNDLFLNAEISAWADGGDTFSNFSLYYRVYSGSPSGSFTQLSASSINNFGGNNWRGFATGANLEALAPANGTYTVETYLSRSHTWTGGGPFTTYLTTAGDTGGTVPTGDYFTASFTVVPEPSTYALLSLAAAGFGAHLWRRRARK